MIRFRLLVAVFAFLVLIIAVLFLPKPTQVRMVVLLTGLEFVVLAFDTSWVYEGLERNRPVGIALILAEIVSLLGLVAFVHSPGDLLRVPLVLVGGRALAAAYLAWPILRASGERGSLIEGWRLFKQAAPLMVGKLARVLFFSFDVLLPGLVINEAAVGLYSAAYRICFVVIALRTAVTFSYLPEFARAARGYDGELAAVSSRSLEFSAAIVLPIAVGELLLAEPLLVAVFGSDYGAAASAFSLLIVSVALSFFRGTARNWPQRRSMPFQGSL